VSSATWDKFSLAGRASRVGVNQPQLLHEGEKLAVLQVPFTPSHRPVNLVRKTNIDNLSWEATHMSQAPARTKPVAGKCLRLSGVDWNTYSRLLYTFAERRDVRLTYDRGELEIMSPRLEHDDDARFLGLLVFALTFELGLPLKCGGSTTLRRRRKRRGIEADECFWITNAHRMAGRRRLNLRIDPPPDLAIEVDVTHGSLDRLAIYAALGVPEVWRLKNDVLTFHVLGADGTYASATHSLAFPQVSPSDLLGFLQQARQTADANAVIRQFRAWIQQRQAAGSGPSTAP
jgi:Uma2 family endonuclease